MHDIRYKILSMPEGAEKFLPLAKQQVEKLVSTFPTLEGMTRTLVFDDGTCTVRLTRMYDKTHVARLSFTASNDGEYWFIGGIKDPTPYRALSVVLGGPTKPTLSVVVTSYVAVGADGYTATWNFVGSDGVVYGSDSGYGPTQDAYGYNDWYNLLYGSLVYNGTSGGGTLNEGSPGYRPYTLTLTAPLNTPAGLAAQAALDAAYETTGGKQAQVLLSDNTVLASAPFVEESFQGYPYYAVPSVGGIRSLWSGGEYAELFDHDGSMYQLSPNELNFEVPDDVIYPRVLTPDDIGYPRCSPGQPTYYIVSEYSVYRKYNNTFLLVNTFPTADAAQAFASEQRLVSHQYPPYRVANTAYATQIDRWAEGVAMARERERARRLANSDAIKQDLIVSGVIPDGLLARLKQSHPVSARISIEKMTIDVSDVVVEVTQERTEIRRTLVMSFTPPATASNPSPAAIVEEITGTYVREKNLTFPYNRYMFSDWPTKDTIVSKGSTTSGETSLGSLVPPFSVDPYATITSNNANILRVVGSGQHVVDGTSRGFLELVSGYAQDGWIFPIDNYGPINETSDRFEPPAPQAETNLTWRYPAILDQYRALVKPRVSASAVPGESPNPNDEDEVDYGFRETVPVAGAVVDVVLLEAYHEDHGRLGLFPFSRDIDNPLKLTVYIDTVVTLRFDNGNAVVVRNEDGSVRRRKLYAGEGTEREEVPSVQIEWNPSFNTQNVLFRASKIGYADLADSRALQKRRMKNEPLPTDYPPHPDYGYLEQKFLDVANALKATL